MSIPVILLTMHQVKLGKVYKNFTVTIDSDGGKEGVID